MSKTIVALDFSSKEEVILSIYSYSRSGFSFENIQMCEI